MKTVDTTKGTILSIAALIFFAGFVTNQACQSFHLQSRAPTKTAPTSDPGEAGVVVGMSTERIRFLGPGGEPLGLCVCARSSANEQDPTDTRTQKTCVCAKP